MKRAATLAMIFLLSCPPSPDSVALAYTRDSTIPTAGGCPQIDRWNAAGGVQVNRRWSTALPGTNVILTANMSSESAELAEIGQAISDSFSAWTGVSGTTLNAATFPNAFSPLGETTAVNACTNDAETNVDGLNTICFDQASAGFTSGVLAFTRVITANAPGVTEGASGPAAFAGQILDADTLLRPDGQVQFATPAALATPAGQGAYDLESILTHELGHWMGLDHSAVMRAMMFPFAPPPGEYTGTRPSAGAPDAPLADDDRTGLRSVYPDPNDAVNIGTIAGVLLPANAFSLATIPSPAAGESVTGIFGGHVVAVDAGTGAVIAGTLGGWSCSAAGTTQFDGSFVIERLPVGHNYWIYAEPLDGIATSGGFSTALGDLCSTNGITSCTTPGVNTNFNGRAMPAGP
ncbi:MAG TPA: matrixin family metalloprotease [Verrucomicrobiae bacterium]|nr:matrixin family metalloprotease [Verrucomicrobiae bacterium]